MTDKRNLGPKLGRLALREEGMFWNAYYAMPDTMDGAVLLGSISMRFVRNEERKAAFMALMRDAISDLFEEEKGVNLEWPEPYGEPAPERERSGHG